MFVILVPTFSVSEVPFTFRSFTTVTESPSCSTLPLASRTSPAARELAAAQAVKTLPRSTAAAEMHPLQQQVMSDQQQQQQQQQTGVR